VNDAKSIAEHLLRGERRALARLISWAENGDPRFPEALGRIYGRVGTAWRTGVTGPPGAGKSTFVNEVARLLRDAGRTVGILAIDPSSPFSGGALLGDRIRMEDRTADPGVYIRSMASRASHGGMARAAVDACDVMDAFGIDEVVVETVGVGQAEYEVVGAADSVVVVLCPGAGDGIQAMKAGILEVADVLVVNKADLPGADRLVLDLEEAVHTRDIDREGWVAPVVECRASTGHGVPDVLDALHRHREHLAARDLDAVRRRHRVDQVRRLVGERLEEELWGPDGYGQSVETALQSASTPYDVASAVSASILGRGSGRRTDGAERQSARS